MASVGKTTDTATSNSCDSPISCVLFKDTICSASSVCSAPWMNAIVLYTTREEIHNTTSQPLETYNDPIIIHRNGFSTTSIIRFSLVSKRSKLATSLTILYLILFGITKDVMATIPPQRRSRITDTSSLKAEDSHLTLYMCLSSIVERSRIWSISETFIWTWVRKFCTSIASINARSLSTESCVIPISVSWPLFRSKLAQRGYIKSETSALMTPSITTRCWKVRVSPSHPCTTTWNSLSTTTVPTIADTNSLIRTGNNTPQSWMCWDNYPHFFILLAVTAIITLWWTPTNRIGDQYRKERNILRSTRNTPR